MEPVSYKQASFFMLRKNEALTIMKYKELSAYEKLKEIQDIHFCRAERHNAAIYLNTKAGTTGQ